jgi:hypothetical protein
MIDMGFGRRQLAPPITCTSIALLITLSFFFNKLIPHKAHVFEGSCLLSWQSPAAIGGNFSKKYIFSKKYTRVAND